MKKVLLVGNYGVGNVGDYMLMESSIQQIKKLESEYVVACPGDIEGSVSIPPAGIRSFFSFKWLSFFKSLKECDLVVFGGGGLLNPEEKMSLLIWGQIIVMAKMYKKKVIMIGQSFSVVDNTVRFLLDKVDAISVRDSFSKKILDEYYAGKIVKVDDLVWNLNIKVNTSLKDQIAINLRPYKYVDNNTLKIVVNNLIDRLEKVMSFKEIVILGFGLEDFDFCKEIVGIGFQKKYVIKFVNDKESIMSEIAKSKIIIAERLHACISTMKLNRPLISLSYSSKVFSMMNDYSVKSIINLRKDVSNLNYEDVIRDALAMHYKKPHPRMDEVLVDVLSE